MSKYTLIKPLPNEFKIKVNPEQSEALQLELFKMGKSWLEGETRVIYKHNPYLYFDDDKIKRGDWSMGFKNSNMLEIQFYDYFTETKQMTPQQLIKEAKEQIARANELIKDAEQMFESQNKEDDKYLDLSNNYSLKYLTVRNIREYAGKGFYLSSKYNWKIVTDSVGVQVLVPTRK